MKLLRVFVWIKKYGLFGLLWVYGGFIDW